MITQNTKKLRELRKIEIELSKIVEQIKPLELRIQKLSEKLYRVLYGDGQ